MYGKWNRIEKIKKNNRPQISVINSIRWKYKKYCNNIIKLKINKFVFTSMHTLQINARIKLNLKDIWLLDIILDKIELTIEIDTDIKIV